MPEATGIWEGLLDFSFRGYATPQDAEVSARDTPTRRTYRRSSMGRAVIPAGPSTRLACTPRRIGRVLFLDSLLPRRPGSARGRVPHRGRDRA